MTAALLCLLFGIAFGYSVGCSRGYMDGWCDAVTETNSKVHGTGRIE